MRAIAFVLGLVVSGCAFMTVSGPGPRTAAEPRTQDYVVPPLFAAAPWYLSAFIGHRRTSKCRDVRAVTGR